jgi:L-threonylcarbamoyladenylate synthase
MSLSPPHRRRAMRALARGEVIAYPTEAVWGLGCDPQNDAAVRRLLQLKARDPAKGLILVAATLDQLAGYIETPSRMAWRRARETWPGPHTWVFPAGDWASPWVTGDHDTLAVRVSAHPVVQALCRAWGGPLVSTSANRAGLPPARNRLAVRQQLGAVTLVPGALGGLGQPTSIREAATGHYLRR